MEQTEEYKKGLKKFKMVMCGEYMLFAIIFAVLGVLFLTKIIGISQWKYWVFPILTLAGGLWMIVDIVWLIKSKARQRRNSFLDKIPTACVALPVMGFDIYFLINNSHIGEQWYEDVFRTVIGVVLCVYAAIYVFQSIFNFFHPSKTIVIGYDDAMKQVAAAEAQEKELAEKQKALEEQKNESEIKK